MSESKEAVQLPPRPEPMGAQGAVSQSNYVYDYTEADTWMDEAERQLRAMTERCQDAENLAAYLDTLQSDYAVKYATETASRLAWQSKAQAAEAECQHLRDQLSKDDERMGRMAVEVVQKQSQQPAPQRRAKLNRLESKPCPQP